MRDKTQTAVTVAQLRDIKARGGKFTCLTAYDASFAHVLDEAGVDVVLVGDSLGMVIQGHTTTVPVTMEQMIYHGAAVARVCRRALVMVDMPFMAYATVEQALANAARLMQEGGAQMVKLEGGAMQFELIEALARRGIPVCAHLGLQPQLVHKLGGYRVQGRAAGEARAMLEDALALQAAGADMLLLECVPAALAAEISRTVSVPVIGIGAGPDTDGQVLVLYDLLGISHGKRPRFSKNFLAGRDSVAAAVGAYVEAVKSGAFPGPEHIFQ